MILPEVRDPAMVTIRRGGTLTDDDHRRLALWAADCAEHVLPLFEREAPEDTRARDAVAATRAWADGTLEMIRARTAGGHAMGAARPLRGAARFAAYAIKAARSVNPEDPAAGRRERDWQRDQLPGQVRELVLADQRRRNSICWFLFDTD